MNIEKLKQIGNEWTGGSHHRVYFNGLTEMFPGLSVNRYGTGNISSASLNGQKISNAKAREMVESLDLGKLWFDLNTNEFCYRIGGNRLYSGDEMAEILIEQIKREAE